MMKSLVQCIPGPIYVPIQLPWSNKPFHESIFGGLHGDKQLDVEDIQEAYVESKDR